MQAVQPFIIKTILLTVLALFAFAANSVLCRYALMDGSLDAASFTELRLLSGAVVLMAIVAFRYRKKTIPANARGSWFAALMLFCYACSFSYGYLAVEAGMGTLVLFGAVQITMILLSLYSGQTLHNTEWLGVVIAFSGLVYLVFPEDNVSTLSGLLLMVIAGMSWAVYSIKGKSSHYALLDTSYNFSRTIPFIVILGLFTFQHAHYSYTGVMLAIISGSITSAIGYAIWYTALTGLSSAQAAVVQLLVPVLAGFGGVIFLSEVLSQRLIIASLLILGGIFMVILGRYYLAHVEVKP